MAKHILIVDDDENMSRTLRDILTHQKYVVKMADGGNLALKIAEVWPFDLLITDIMMPGMNGLELANKMARDYPHIKIFFITAHTSYKNFQEAGKLGYVLTKPINIQVLLENLNK